MKCNLHIGNVQTLIVQLNTDICTDHMYTPPNQDREYSHHSLCLSLVQTRDRHYSDLCISPEITDSVLEVFNNGIITFHVYIYVLFILGAPKSLQMVTAAMKLKDTCSLEEKLWPTYHIKNQSHCQTGLSRQTYGFPSSHVWIWELDYKESWVLKNWCFWTVVLEKTLKRPLDCKEIKPVNPIGNQSWIFIGRTDAEAETPILWPPDAKNWLIGKDPDARKDWRQEERGKTGWDGWMTSLTRWTRVWASSSSWWWTGNPGMLQCVGSQTVRHYWVTELRTHYLVFYYKCLRM